MLGIGVSLRALRSSVSSGAIAAFSPADLFASGEEGAWYEPSTTTAFLSTTDLTPCGYSDGCGFLLDKSQGAGYSGGSFTGLGSEANGNPGDPFTTVTPYRSIYATGTGPTLSGSVLVAANSSSWSAVGSDISVTAGKTYLIEADADLTAIGAAGRFRVNDGITTATTVIAEIDATSTGRQTFRAVVTPTASTIHAGVYTYNSASNPAVTLYSLSIRELPGNHATQVTAGARPILARVPESGRRNLLEYTEEFDDAKWLKGASPDYSVTPNDTTDPNGDVTADKLTALTSVGSLGQSVTLTATAHSLSFYVKYSNHDWFRIGYIGSASNAAWFNVQTGAKGTVVGAGNTSEIEPLSNGWYRVTLNIAAGSTSPEQAFISLSSGDGVVGGASSGDSIYIWGAQLELGSTATAYQRVVDEYDITEAGVTSLEYLSFDGSDDFMTAGTNADWNYLHDGTGCEFVIGLTPADVADTNAFETVMSTHNCASNTVGTFLGAEDRSGVLNQGWSYGVNPTGVFIARSADTITSLTDNYVVRGGHKSGETPEYFFYDDEVLEHSGSYARAPSTANSQNPLTIGQAIGNGFYWSGNMFGLIIRNAQLTEDQRTNTSNYMANLSGVTLP